MSETISVIIPAYNAEKYIRAAVQSVLDQTRPVHEIIIIDDGSTDGTRQAVEEIQKQRGTGMPVLRHIFQQNQGPAVARNTGIKNAAGDYIAFLDSDDYWLPARLKKQMEVFRARPEAGLVCSGRFRVDETTGRKTIDCAGSKFSNDSYRDLWTQGNYVVTSSVLARRRCLEEAGGFDEDSRLLGGEDADMWLRVAEKFQIVYVNEPLVGYLVRTSGLNRSNIQRSYEAAIFAIQKHEMEFRRRYTDASSVIRRRWGSTYYAWGVTLFDAEQFAQARTKFAMAWKFHGLSIQTLRFYLLTLLGPNVLGVLKMWKKRLGTLSDKLLGRALGGLKGVRG